MSPVPLQLRRDEGDIGLFPIIPCCWPRPHLTYLLVHFNVQSVRHLIVLRAKSQHSLVRSCPEQLAHYQPAAWQSARPCSPQPNSATAAEGPCSPPAHEKQLASTPWAETCATSLGQGREQPQCRLFNTCNDYAAISALV